MAAIELSEYLMPPANDVVPTQIDAAQSTVYEQETGLENRAKWEKLIDYTLIEWGRNPDAFEDEGVEPPTAETVSLAFELARRFKQAGLQAPDKVLLDANGGVVFERRGENITEVFYVWDDGSIEYQRFQHTRLVERWAF